jgi:hypothetical protein
VGPRALDVPTMRWSEWCMVERGCVAAPMQSVAQRGMSGQPTNRICWLRAWKWGAPISGAWCKYGGPSTLRRPVHASCIAHGVDIGRGHSWRPVDLLRHVPVGQRTEKVMPRLDNGRSIHLA